MSGSLTERLSAELRRIEAQGLRKHERVIPRPRAPRSGRPGRARCSTSAPTTTSASPTTRRSSRPARRRSDRWATAWPRCASSAARRTIHKELEARLARFLGTEDAILYSSCFDANGGLFETLLGEEDAIISDALNHASIIDGVRLCKAKRFRYANNDMADLEAS